MYKGFVDFYLDIFISVDHTRVKLKDVDPNVLGSEYINANYIKVQFQDFPHLLILSILDTIIFVYKSYKCSNFTFHFNYLA